MPVWCYFCKKN